MYTALSTLLLRRTFSVETSEKLPNLRERLRSSVSASNALPFTSRRGFKGTIRETGFTLRPFAERAKDSKASIRILGTFSTVGSGTRVKVLLRYNWIWSVFYWLLVGTLGTVVLSRFGHDTPKVIATLLVVTLLIPVSFWWNAYVVQRNMTSFLTNADR